MKENNRSSVVFGTMNSMFFIQGNKQQENRLFSIVDNQKIYSQMSIQESFNTQIQISSIVAWFFLLLSVVFSSFIPCWLMGDIKAESLTRNSWRYFTISILLLPFLLYQQRNIKNQNEKFFNLLTVQNLKIIIVSTINYCVWLICLIYACKFTSMNHAVCLTGLKVFLSSLIRIRNGQKYHQFQVGGNMLCVIGIVLVLTDSITLPQYFNENAQKYLRTDPWKRLLIGDSLAIIGSFVALYLDQRIKVPTMPRFTYLFLYNLFLCFNLISFGYFFGGNQFSNNIKFGIFGLFTYENFVNIFYVSVMLGLNLMLVNILISEVFNSLVINVAACFQLVITSMIYHVLGQQLVPSGLTCLGYSFLVPGLIFIIGGQGALQNNQNKFNFELYRPSSIRFTRLTGVPSLMIKRSLSSQICGSSPNPISPLRQKQQKQKAPFQMIIEQEESETRENFENNISNLKRYN